MCPGSKSGTLRLIKRSGLAATLFDPERGHEFFDALGRGLKSARLLRLAFRRAAGSPAAAMRNVHTLMAAGTLNVFSSSALEALHAGMAGWPRPETVGALLARVAGEMDSAAQAGLFLGLFLTGPASVLTPEEEAAALAVVAHDADVRDLAGRREDLVAGLPVVHREAALEQLGASSEESDEDEAGNLAGFVTYSDEEEEAEEGSGDGSGSDGGSGSAGREGAARKRARQVESSGKSSNAGGTSGKRRRLQRAGGAPTASSGESSAGSPARGGGGGGGATSGASDAAAASAAAAFESRFERYVEREAEVGRAKAKGR